MAGETIVVIGTGGAAHAILFALARLDIKEVILCARNALKGAALLARFGLRGKVLPFTARLPAANTSRKRNSQGKILGSSGWRPFLAEYLPWARFEAERSCLKNWAGARILSQPGLGPKWISAAVGAIPHR